MLTLTEKEVDALDPKTVAVTMWVGSDDVLTYVGLDILKNSEEWNKKGESLRLSEALDYLLEDVSWNSFNLLVFHEGKMQKFTIKEWA